MQIKNRCLLYFVMFCNVSDVPFYPEIYYNGEYYPICGIDLNDQAAAMACTDIDRLTEVSTNKIIQHFHHHLSRNFMIIFRKKTLFVNPHDQESADFGRAKMV